MLATDRDALLCDLAEVYHIFDFHALPVLTLAALSVGLRDDSRIKMKMAGITYVPPVVILASIADNLAALRYSLTAKKGAEKPKMFMKFMTQKQPDRKPARKTAAYRRTLDGIMSDVQSRIEKMKGGEGDG